MKTVFDINALFGLATLLLTTVALVLAIFAFVKELQFKKLNDRIRSMERLVEQNRNTFEYMHEVDDICSAYITELPEVGYGSSLKFKTLLNTIINPPDSIALAGSLSSVGGFAHDLVPITNSKIKNLLVHLWRDGWFHHHEIEKQFVVQFHGNFNEYPPPLLNRNLRSFPD